MAEESGLVRRIITGAFWQGGTLFFQSGLRFLTKLILAYLLVPEDFGLIGMALVFTGLVIKISEAGLGSALVQRKGDDLSDDEKLSAHRAAIFLSTAFYLLLIIPGAIPVAAFFHEPRLKPIIWALGLAVVIRSLATWEFSALRRQLRFREWATLEAIAALLSSIIAILAAFLGAGVWSIVTQSLLFNLFLTLFLKRRVEPLTQGRASLAALKGFLHYSLFVTGNQLLRYLTEKLDYLVVGRIVGAAQLGLYTLAYMLTDTIRTQIMAALTQVLFPIYSQVQDDRPQVNRFYLAAIRFNCFFVFPLVAFYLVFPALFILQVFGNEWIGAEVPLFFLALAAMIHTIGGTSDSVLKAIGYPQLQFRIQSTKLVLFTLPAMIVGTLYWGLMGATIAVVLDKTIERIWYQRYMSRFVGTGELEILRALLPALLGFTSMVLILLFFREFHPPSTLLGLIAIALLGGLGYLLVTLPLLWKDGRALYSQLKQQRSNA